MSLLQAPAAVQKAVASGAIQATIGYELAKLEPEEAKANLALMVEASKSDDAPAGKRAKAKKQREATGMKNMRRRPEVQKMLDAMREKPVNRATAIRALEWVLGGEEAPL